MFLFKKYKEGTVYIREWVIYAYWKALIVIRTCICVNQWQSNFPEIGLAVCNAELWNKNLSVEKILKALFESWLIKRYFVWYQI